MDTTCLICPGTHISPFGRIMYSFPNNRGLLKLHLEVARPSRCCVLLPLASGCLFRFMVVCGWGRAQRRMWQEDLNPWPHVTLFKWTVRNDQSLIITQELLLALTCALFMWGKGQAIEVAPSRKSWIFNTDLHFYLRQWFSVIAAIKLNVVLAKNCGVKVLIVMVVLGCRFLFTLDYCSQLCWKDVSLCFITTARE